LEKYRLIFFLLKLIIFNFLLFFHLRILLFFQEPITFMTATVAYNLTRPCDFYSNGSCFEKS